MTRRLIHLIERLPFGVTTKRALVETLVDNFYERRGGVMAVIRVILAATVSWASDRAPLRFLGNDLRASMRRLRASPGYLVFSALTLAVAIGSTTAIYSVVYAALYRQQPIPHLEQVMNIYQSDMSVGASGPLICLSARDFAGLQESQTVFSSMAAWTRFSGTLIADGGSEPLLGEMVSGSYFSLLGVNAAVGRTLQPADDVAGAPAVIVLSDSLWRRMFGADPSAIGRTIRLQGQPFQIVGVAPPWFRGSDMPNLLPTPAWIPLRTGRSIAPRPDELDSDRRNLFLKGRLRADATVEQARAEVTAISRRIVAAEPERRSSRDPMPGNGLPPNGWFVLPMGELRLHESVHGPAGMVASVLMVAVVLVLLVACSNLANLTLARAARRRQEIAVRVALGASRLRILREQIVESAVVSVIGWALGLLVALAVMRFLGQSVQMHAAVTITLQLQPALNVPVLAASLFATALTILAVGLGPAIRQTRSNVRAAIAADGLAVAPRWRLRGALVAGQVATSVLLLALSTMCLRELRASTQHDPGFALDQLAVLQLDFSANQYAHARVLQELDAVSNAVRSVSGVQSVAVMSALPIGSGRPASAGVGTAGAPPSMFGRGSKIARWMAVSGPVFETLGIRLVSGRALTTGDGATTDRVVVVSESLAEALYPHGAVGQKIAVKRQYFQPDRPLVEATIVGVAADTDTEMFGRAGGGHAVYLPLAQTDEMYASVVARTSGSPDRVVGSMREVMRGVDREVAVTSADTGLAIAGPAVMVLQVTGGIAGALGGFALLLAVTGLYGVLADVVSRRTREIGIRIALGAPRGTIYRNVLLGGLMPTAFGALIGMGLAFAAFTVLPAFVFLRQLKTGGPESAIFAAIPLAAAALVACYIPARRASRVDPNVALREL